MNEEELSIHIALTGAICIELSLRLKLITELLGSSLITLDDFQRQRKAMGEIFTQMKAATSKQQLEVIHQLIKRG